MCGVERIDDLGFDSPARGDQTVNIVLPSDAATVPCPKFIPSTCRHMCSPHSSSARASTPH